MSRLRIVWISSLALFTLPAIAQSPDISEPGSVEAIAAATTDPHYVSPWVSYVPQSSTVPSPEKFLGRIFTATERATADRRARRGETYAKRFAAKEACAKALGTGLRAGVFWRDMGVVNLPSGRPTMKLTGGALMRLQAITPAGCEPRIDVTITDEGPMAHAFVIISAVATPSG